MNTQTEVCMMESGATIKEKGSALLSVRIMSTLEPGETTRRMDKAKRSI